MPSYHEGLPIAALEAGSCGAPMLLSDIRPNRDVGLAERHYFPVGYIAALSAAIDRPTLHYAVDSDAIRERFCWDRAAVETLAICRDLAPDMEAEITAPA